MALGMTYEQYWYGDPLMVRAFYEADKIRQRRINETAWLQGAYVYRALMASVGNMTRKRGTRAIEYPDQPAEIFETKAQRSGPEEANERNAVFAKAYMAQMMMVGKNWGK